MALHILAIVIRVCALCAKLAAVWPSAALAKRAALARFARELAKSGVPPEAVRQLTLAYRDMVSLNPLDYIPARTRAGRTKTGYPAVNR